MRVKKGGAHGPRHVTPAGRSVFYDLFPAEKAAEMEVRAQLLMGLEQWLERSGMTQAAAAVRNLLREFCGIRSSAVVIVLMGCSVRHPVTVLNQSVRKTRIAFARGSSG